jgi:hypothetical protein
VVAQRATWIRAVAARQTPHAKPVDVSAGRVLSIPGAVPSGAHFVFNMYKHWDTFVIRKNNGTGELLYSRQCITQGDPLVMFYYELDLLPLTHQLKTEFPNVEHPWYADDAGADAVFALQRLIFLHLKDL